MSVPTIQPRSSSFPVLSLRTVSRKNKVHSPVGPPIRTRGNDSNTTVPFKSSIRPANARRGAWIRHSFPWFRRILCAVGTAMALHNTNAGNTLGRECHSEYIRLHVLRMCDQSRYLLSNSERFARVRLEFEHP